MFAQNSHCRIDKHDKVDLPTSKAPAGNIRQLKAVKSSIVIANKSLTRPADITCILLQKNVLRKLLQASRPPLVGSG